MPHTALDKLCPRGGGDPTAELVIDEWGRKAGMGTEVVQDESREWISPQTKGSVCSRGEKREKHEVVCFEGGQHIRDD